MSAPRSGHGPKGNSKSVSSGSEGSKRREKARSSQVYDNQRYDARRRGSEQAESGPAVVPERPGGKARTNSAPVAEAKGGATGSRDAVKDGEHSVRTSASTLVERGGAENGQDVDEVAGVAGAATRLQPFLKSGISEALPDINIAVIGAEGVGKSTFVQNVLDLPSPPSSQAAERRISVDGNDYLLRLLEMPLDDVDIDDDDQTVSWPETIENKVTPKIDGVLTLYDVKDQSSLENIPEMLNAIDKIGLPSVLVSNKCDSPLEEREIDPDTVERMARRHLKHLNAIQTSAKDSLNNKKSISIILQYIMSNVQEENRRSSPESRRRAVSTAVRPVSPQKSANRGHMRANSEYTGSLYKEQRHSRHDSSGVQYGPADRMKVQLETKPRPSDDMYRSFLFEESGSEASTESPRSSADAEAIQHAVLAAQQTSASDEGTSFPELVERLLAMPTSKADDKFVAIFLALYRKFAPPGQLLESIVERFDNLNQNGEADIIKTASQLRYLAIMEQWISTYPGDFAHPKTTETMRAFIGKLSQSRIMAVAAKEMNADLDAVLEDDDTNWAYCDRDRASTVNEYRMSNASTLIDDPTFSIPDDVTVTPASLRENSKLSTASDGDAVRSMSSSAHLMANLETAQRQAQLLTPIPRQPVTKVQWRLLIDYSDDVLARELTRMDWTMFSSIRPRDLVRQVSSGDKQKASYKNLVYVNRMIEHFNQLAFWVENYILLRDKPKHRALMLEKFMRVARKLREMNNYNALGAIIAGVKSSSLHRLTATRELIPPSVGKDWMKLEILMAPSRSHFAYRLAWENSTSERIPYLPLHIRDLVSAEEGNKTFVGDEKLGKISWAKFEIVGEVIVSMQKAQGTPYKNLGSGRGNELVKELVLDVKLDKDEDNLFQRSKQLEPSGTATIGSSAKFKEFFKR